MKKQLALAAALPMILYAILGGAMLRKNGGDVSRFVVAGDAFTDPASAPPCLTVLLDSGGYDGQFYYRLAVAPLAFQQQRVAGVRFDFPVYRQQRIGYPLLASVMALGDPCRAVWALPVVNLLAIGVIGFLGGLLLANRGLPAILGAALTLYPGLILTFARDTTEIVGMAFLLLGVWLLLRGKLVVGALALTFASLTRETALVAAAVLGCIVVGRAFRDRRDRVRAVAATVLPFAGFVGWKLFLFHAWNLPVNFGSSGVFTIPFAGIASILRRSTPAIEHWQRVQWIEIILLGVFAAIWGVVAFTRRAPFEHRLTSAAYFCFAVVLSSAIWLEDWAYLRATSEFGVLALLVALHAPARARAFVVALTLSACVALAWDVVTMR